MSTLTGYLIYSQECRSMKNIINHHGDWKISDYRGRIF